MNADFLGQGLKFPFEFSRRTGAPGISTATSADHAHIRESILQILGTRVGERLMRPDFGSRLHELVFEQNTDVLKGLLRFRINEAIGRWEKRVVVTGVSFEESPASTDKNRISVRIAYRIITSQVEGNLVYPFYREQA